MRVHMCAFVLVLTCVVTSWAQIPATHCDIICNEEIIEPPTCASDGKLYASSCEFQKAQCLAQQSGGTLMVVSVGACVTVDTSCDVVLHTKCIPGVVLGSMGQNNQIEAICGSDGVSYKTVCEFRTRQCQLLAASGMAPLHLEHMGKCDGTDLANGTAINCTKYVTVVSGVAIEGTVQTYYQPIHCNRTHNPVCSIDKQTYGSECIYCSYLVGRKEIGADLIGYISYEGSCMNGAIFG